jgi:hypothetical protein
MNRKPISRILCLLLSALLSFSALACANGSTDEADTSAVPSGDIAAETPEETEKLYLDNLPETMDWDGYEVRFLTAEETHSVQLDDDNATGNNPLDATIYDAYWRRNEALLSRMNASLKLCEKTGYGSFSAAATQSVTAGSDDYDVFCGHTRFNVALAASGAVMKMNENGFMDTIDISAPYWSQLYIENINYKDNIYWITGDLTHTFISIIYAMFVNGTVWNDYFPGENVYDLVFEGNWTLDKMSELCENVYRDLNGNGEVDKNDAFGVVMQKGHTLNGMVFASGITYTGRDDAGEYAVILNNEHTVDAFNKLHAIFYDTNYGIMLENAEFDGTAVDMFTGDRLLFCPYTIGLAGNEKVRNMESDFMILPLPKYDEQQETYRVNQYDGVPIYGCPITLPTDRVPMISAILEADCSMTSKFVIPAYYDLALKNKYSRDATTAQMIDLIHDSITADFCFYWGDSVGGLMDVFYSNIQNDEIASTLKKNEKVWAKTLSKLIGKLEG